MIQEEPPLADQLLAAFRDAPYTRGYNLSVLELPHALVIQGTVRSFFHKQMAQEHAGKFLQDKMQQGLRLMLRNEIVVE